MVYTQEKLQAIAQLCGIPTIERSQRVWIVRTESGSYYRDFTLNGYVALGWDKIPRSKIDNEQRIKEEVIGFIEKMYPEEKRPGLIYSQLVTFICKMQKGDCIVIPSTGSSHVYIGILGDLFEVNAEPQEMFEEDYSRCMYRLRRHVKWHKEAAVREDIYLTKVLRSHQTISDISEHADLIYRNMYEFYFIDGTLSLTLRKKSDNSVAFEDEYALYRILSDTVEIVNTTLGHTEKLHITKRTAMSSPGFFEMVISFVSNPSALIVFAILFLVIGGKVKTGEGIEAKGIASILQGISNLANDKTDRELKRAQVKKLEAETHQIQVQTQQQEIENAKAFLELMQQVPIGSEDKKETNILQAQSANLLETIQQKKEEIEPIMEKIGMHSPVVELPNNIIPFPAKKDT